MNELFIGKHMQNGSTEFKFQVTDDKNSLNFRYSSCGSVI